VSVVIPVRDDAARLRACLRALERQSLAEPFEILVVDNGSADDPSAVVERHSRARLLSEEKPGSYAARNTGAKAAKGETLAFTDSDCLPAPDWLERGLARAVEAGDRAFVGGRVDVFVRNPKRPTATELYELVHGFPQRAYVENESFSVTANMFVNRSAFDAVGQFEEGVISSGDFEWGRRARAASVRPLYADDVRVGHPARRSLRELARKSRRRYVGASQLRALGKEHPASRKPLRRRLQPPLRSTVRNFSRLEPASVRSKALYAGAAFFVHYHHIYGSLVAAREA
jgi:glycosyltransferase involved in cell wall biosynthesis